MAATPPRDFRPCATGGPSRDMMPGDIRDDAPTVVIAMTRAWSGQPDHMDGPSTTFRDCDSKSSRGMPHDLPLSHHRACGSRTAAVSVKMKRGVMVGQADEAACIEPRDRHRPLGLFAGGQAPPAFARR